jgi:hypothetical protein
MKRITYAHGKLWQIYQLVVYGLKEGTVITLLELYFPSENNGKKESGDENNYILS